MRVLIFGGGSVFEFDFIPPDLESGARTSVVDLTKARRIFSPSQKSHWPIQARHELLNTNMPSSIFLYSTWCA